ncbi:MAG: type-F conjugative transfer system pilin assembly protein TrbC [Candidatus Dadabacteria bacterium]|nr:type-F conjugative transfer system pilin assembly protein TrbC [Candidatus Dadabacteria bacterium]MYA48775.1 type-F conjugative transfer system pilin assembly protein TrbC [Candidatus Dadabacteria bacterium]MYG82409.1 type-F conjugative transfer system pilin assembly protein TrbC [Candidatus Dadabacteria bacterium]MYK49349.1 type-F conjugative transfer system pilin assembly protein TrbC [Candidatus Dadabacteria bacterium]
MEKKRLLPALIVAALAVSGTVASHAQDPASLQGIRMKSEEAKLAHTKRLLGDLMELDIAGAEKMLSDTKNNYPGEKQTEEAMKVLSVKSRRAAAFPEKSATSKNEKSRLFYFFSLSMPHTSLREAAQESAAAGAVMVLRGLSGGDLRKTASRISQLIGKTETEAWIDPLLFECFSVGLVPQIVLAYGQPTGTDCEGTRYVKVSGDVSLPYALGLMEKEDPNAGMFIERLEKNGFYRD